MTEDEYEDMETLDRAERICAIVVMAGGALMIVAFMGITIAEVVRACW